LELPSAHQGWSIFGITLVVGPLLGILLEAIIFVVLIFIVGLYASTNRELAQQLSQLAEILKNSSNPDTLVAAAAPIMFTPIGMLTLLGLFSIAIPAIEEAVKVAALWVFADKIKHPVHGFALGILCGAAFALAENLGFSGTGANDWLSTASLRASSVLPHMLNSGILGWALVVAWKKHSYLKLALAYTAVMLIHGLWNAISLALWLNSLNPYVENVPGFLDDPVPFFSGWVVLIIGTLAGLVYGNWSLRGSLPANVEYNEPLSLNSGDNHGNSEHTD
jgi:RsiW-degrading membrane proteinase PrsW (M82 family)